MATEERSDYAYRARLDVPYLKAVEMATAALQEEGFGVLTEIDVKATLKKKLDVDFREYSILGACNPPLANKALSTEIEVGLLLPCNVIVYADNGGSVVAALDPIAALSVAHNEGLMPVAEDARARLQRVIGSLAGNAAG
jgi:uncharacterized protein (DUF302 family)